MPRVVVAANNTWNIKNFRSGLIRELIRSSYDVLTISSDEYGLELDGTAIPHRRCAMARAGTNPFHDLRYLISLLITLRCEKADVFLGFTIKPNIYGSLACRLLGIAAIPNVTGLGTAFLSRTWLRQVASCMYRLAFARASIVFFQNPEDQALFVQMGIVGLGESFVLPGSGVDLNHFHFSGLPTGEKFLMVSRLLADKGVREYIQAARQVRQRMPTAAFSLVGELDPQNPSGIGRDELDEWIRDGVVQYLGATEDVRPFVKQAAAVVLPSYREGLPRTLLEAAAMGRVLIGTDVPGCRQVVREGITGFLCEPKSPASLADAIERFASSGEQQRSQMAANARRMAETEFDERVVSSAYIDVIQSLTRGQ